MGVATTLDPARLSSTTLSGGNLVGTSTGSGGAESSKVCSGLTYLEATITTLTGTPAIGIADSRWDHSTQLGSSTNTIGYQPSGAVKYNSTTLTTIAAYVQGNRTGVAIDPIKRLLWFRVNGGNWNNNATYDPVAGVGGIDFSSYAIGSIVAAICASLTGNVWTMNFSGAFTDTVPTGYASMDTVAYATATVVNSKIEVPSITSLPASYGITGALATDQTTQGKHFTPAGALTKVSGVTEEGGSSVPGRLVEVYDRSTGDLIGRTISASDGTWSVYALGRPAVRVVGSDPTTYNSQVYDNVVPV